MGDRVTAEAFMQHCEHYVRLVAIAQSEQQQRAQSGPNGRERNGASREGAPERQHGGDGGERLFGATEPRREAADGDAPGDWEAAAHPGSGAVSAPRRRRAPRGAAGETKGGEATSGEKTSF